MMGQQLGHHLVGVHSVLHLHLTGSASWQRRKSLRLKKGMKERRKKEKKWEEGRKEREKKTNNLVCRSYLVSSILQQHKKAIMTSKGYNFHSHTFPFTFCVEVHCIHGSTRSLHQVHAYQLLSYCCHKTQCSRKFIKCTLNQNYDFRKLVSQWQKNVFVAGPPTSIWLSGMFFQLL